MYGIHGTTLVSAKMVIQSKNNPTFQRLHWCLKLL